MPTKRKTPEYYTVDESGSDSEGDETIGDEVAPPVEAESLSEASFSAPDAKAQKSQTVKVLSEAWASSHSIQTSRHTNC